MLSPLHCCHLSTRGCAEAFFFEFRRHLRVRTGGHVRFGAGHGGAGVRGGEDRWHSGMVLVMVWMNGGKEILEGIGVFMMMIHDDIE